MKEFFQYMWLMWKRQTVVTTEVSLKVCTGRGYITSYHASGEGGGAFHIHIKEGVDAGAPTLIHSHGATNGTDSFTPAFPLPFQKGLFIEISSGTPSITLAFINNE
jgi:hypothetical protein